VQTLPKVATEMALCGLGYNLTRVINIVGVEKMIVRVRA
jgi:transposase